MPTTRHIAWAATLVSVAGTLTALSTSLASAGIHGIEVEQCGSDGRTCVTPTTIVVGQSYWVQAPYDGVSISGPTSSFYDNGACIGGGGYSVTWVPLTAGTHTLTTRTSSGLFGQSTTTDTYTVTVVPAPAGAPIAQQPQQGGCGGGGSLGNLLPGSSGF
ncbi:hypothetical protein VMT65_12525 [Nocardia sp. CDC153]|uniref:hypothetical protein n=1 Tax=Nocardia sp. CDC153 TaxID=3112167 RepID=UPI002DBB2EC3|nr:hypothetical protein [Nocardia sp. CDC153]MEC3953855.1 hypothetical protein [Nocardia sp. CDC153]